MTALLDAYTSNGSCFVAGVLTADDVASLRRGISECYRQLTGSGEPREGANTLHFDHVFSSHHDWMRRFVFWAIGAFTQSEAYRTYEELYGPRIVFPLQKCIARYQRPDHVASYLPYHQDLDASKTEAHMMNCWVALDHCGTDAPGLEFVNARLDKLHGDLFMSETLDQAGAAKWDTQLRKVMDRFGEGRVSRPAFAPGDGIIFDHFTMHRTYFDPSMAKPRMSVEFRAANADAYESAYGEVARIIATRGATGVQLTCSPWFSDGPWRQTITEKILSAIRHSGQPAARLKAYVSQGRTSRA